MTTQLTRRAALCAAPAALALPTATRAASPAPSTPLPDWFHRLTGPGAEGDPGVFLPWQDTETTRKLAYHMQAIHDLMVESAPEGVTDIKGVQWRMADLPKGVWATGVEEPNTLHQFRPEFGWSSKIF